MYIALAMYTLAVVGIAAALVFGRWDDEIDLVFKWLIGALAMIGFMAFLYDLCIRTPRGLWLALKERIDARIAIVNGFMTQGRNLRDSIDDTFVADPCAEWERMVYDWLDKNQPEFKEQFRIEFVPGGQQRSPTLANDDAANWLNTLDRRLSALGTLLNQLQGERKLAD